MEMNGKGAEGKTKGESITADSREKKTDYRGRELWPTGGESLGNK